MEGYLTETPTIDYMNPHIQEKVQELMNQSGDNLDYIKRSYMFVRDEIPHSWDIKTGVVSRTASVVLKNKTGICWTKSCLLSALLRANQIPSGISYQLLTRADDAGEGYMIHALNTVHIKDLEDEFNCHVDVISKGSSNKKFLDAVSKDEVLLYERKR